MAKELKLGVEELMEDSSLTVNAEDRVDTGLKVQRKPYVSKKDHKQYWLYHVITTIRGRTFEVNLVPKGKDDVGGFVLMDLAFGEFGEVPLYKSEFSFKDNEGKDVNGVRYEMGYADELGDMFVTVKPAKESDKVLLQLALDHAAKVKAKAEAESAAENIVPDPEKPDKNKKG